MKITRPCGHTNRTISTFLLSFPLSPTVFLLFFFDITDFLFRHFILINKLFDNLKHDFKLFVVFFFHSLELLFKLSMG